MLAGCVVCFARLFVQLVLNLFEVLNALNKFPYIVVKLNEREKCVVFIYKQDLE